MHIFFCYIISLEQAKMPFLYYIAASRVKIELPKKGEHNLDHFLERTRKKNRNSKRIELSHCKFSVFFKRLYKIFTRFVLGQFFMEQKIRSEACIT